MIPDIAPAKDAIGNRNEKYASKHDQGEKCNDDYSQKIHREMNENHQNRKFV